MDESIISTQNNRVDTEENLYRKSFISIQETSWRQSQEIPSSVPTTWDKEEIVDLNGIQLNTKVNNVVRFVEKLPLKRYQKSAGFYSSYLKNFIPPTWDEENLSYRYQIINNKNNEILPFSLGKPVIDSASGVLRFLDENILKALDLSLNYPISISFYKYNGILGFFGSQEGEALPFSDEYWLLLNRNQTSIKAKFLLDKLSKSTSFNLVEDDSGYQENLKNVLLLQSNFKETFYHEINLDGGVWI
jgi:hypothetical protein